MESHPNLERARWFDGVHQKGQTLTYHLPVHCVVWAGGLFPSGAGLVNLGDLPVYRRAFSTSKGHHRSRGR